MKPKIRWMIDIQAHILPEAESMDWDQEEALSLLHRAYEKGFRKIIATPDFRLLPDPSGYPDEKERLSKLLTLLESEGRQRGMKIKLYLGQEIEYFEDLGAYLDRGWALTLAKSPYVLIRFSSQISFVKLTDAVRKLEAHGYIPIITQVNHFLCLREQGKIEELIEAGALLHLSLDSFCGKPFDRGVRWCKSQVVAGNIHYIGSNIDVRNPSSLKDVPFINWYRKKDPEHLWKLLHVNPLLIIKGSGRTGSIRCRNVMSG